MTTVPAPDDGIDDAPEVERTPEVEPSVEVGRGHRRGRITRIAGAIGVLVLTGAVAAAGFAVPAPADVAVAPLTVDVPPAAQTLVCAGALTRPAGIGAGDSAFNPTPVDAISEVRAVSVAPAGAGAAPAGTLKPLAGGTTLKGLGPTGAKAEALRAAGITGASVLRADPVGDQPPRAAAASASVTTAGDLRGLAAASCQEPAADQWLVGGSTELGNSATLVVANSGATAADVSVELFGPSGAVDLAGSAAFLVAPGAERALLLEGVAAEQKRIAVHVSAAGGLITAHVQDSRLDGFTPAGVDLVSAGPAPPSRTRSEPNGVSTRRAANVGESDARTAFSTGPG